MTRDAPEEDPLPELLDSLEATLSALREELDPEAPRMGWERSTRDRRLRPPRPPRPPRMREVLRFTDEYTIPALVAVLEANVRLLKLAQAGIRAVDPERSIGDDGRGPAALGDELRRVAGEAGRTSADRLASSLSELQRALAEADTPESPEARDLLLDARDLSSEIERRVRESREQTDLTRFDTDAGRPWSRSRADRGADGPVQIDVTDESDREDDGGDGAGRDDDPEVDVDAELESIRREVDGEGADDEDGPDSSPETDDSRGSDAGEDERR